MAQPLNGASQPELLNVQMPAPKKNPAQLNAGIFLKAKKYTYAPFNSAKYLWK